MTLEDLHKRYIHKVNEIGLSTLRLFDIEPDEFVFSFENAVHGVSECRRFITPHPGYPHDFEIMADRAKQAYIAAKAYLIARDEGMAAAMLWKLSQD